MFSVSHDIDAFLASALHSAALQVEGLPCLLRFKRNRRNAVDEVAVEVDGGHFGLAAGIGGQHTCRVSSLREVTEHVVGLVSVAHLLTVEINLILTFEGGHLVGITIYRLTIDDLAA